VTANEPGPSPQHLFERRAGLYGTGWTAYFWEFGRLLTTEVAATSGARALDVASGTGAVALPLAQSGMRVVALDVSAPMLARFPRNAAALPVTRVLGSAQALPLLTASVDIVTCGFGIAFFPDLAGALAEMRRVLRPTGQLALSWWRFDVATPWVEAQRIRSTVDAEAARRQRSLDELSDPDEVKRRVLDAGFESPRVRHLTLAWTEESVAAFRDVRASLWARERGAPVPIEALDQLEAAAVGWTSDDGQVRYPLRAFAVLARGPGDRAGTIGPPP
jgi:ubiquinone/menaquinone biosynthesis C-methylase UbiE